MGPAESSELAATAVEVVHGKPARGLQLRVASRFVEGIAVGVAACAVLVQVWLAVELANMAGMYRDFGDVQLPALTRLTIATPWLWGAPAFGAVAVASLVARRPRQLAIYVVVAALLVATVVGTWYFAQSPIRELAGNIRSE